MNIRNKIFEITVVVYVFRFVRPVEECAASFVTFIEIQCVSGHYFLHELRYAAFLSFAHNEMKMIWHKAISDYVNERFTAWHIEYFRERHFSELLGNWLRLIGKIEKPNKAFVIITVQESATFVDAAII